MPVQAPRHPLSSFVEVNGVSINRCVSAINSLLLFNVFPNIYPY